MALGETVGEAQGVGQLAHKYNMLSRWFDVCDAAGTADNSGSTIVDPTAIARAAQHKFRNTEGGKLVQVRLKYKKNADQTTAPVVQGFGFDAAGSPSKLFTNAASPANTGTLTAAKTTDVQDGTYGYSDPVEFVVDGAKEVMFAVKTAGNLSDNTTLIVQARYKSQ